MNAEGYEANITYCRERVATIERMLIEAKKRLDQALASYSGIPIQSKQESLDVERRESEEC